MRQSSFAALAGLDEAGRGPWAGPLTAAVVVASKPLRLKGLKDSKQLTALQREALAEKIMRTTEWGIGWVTAQEIDHWGLTEATAKAFRRALKQIKAPWPPLKIDGKARYRLSGTAEYIIRGDQKVPVISAASVLAKVSRDRWMRQHAMHWPAHAFETHKGYGTALHQAQLAEYGITRIHRRSYRPIQKLRAKEPTNLV